MIYEGLLYNRVDQYLDNNIVINIDTYSIKVTPTPPPIRDSMHYSQLNLSANLNTWYE